MTRDTSIQKSFRRGINLQTRTVTDKKGSSHDRAFIAEGCIMRMPEQTLHRWENNAA